MKTKYLNYRIIFVIALVLMFFSNTAFAAWVWTPQTKKFINPKTAVKDSPKEQFDWAMSFYNAKDYTRAVTEFEKLVKNYEYSEYASVAQYYVGLSYENMGKLYLAFQNYQKAVDNFPHIENLDEIIAREFNIANFYASKDSPKILGMEIMMALDRAIEIYKKVVDNAPYGKLADEAQLKMAEALKKSERYDEAMVAFQKVVDDYPNSQFADKAKYEVAHCAYKASLKPAYDIEPTDKAIKAFQDFAETNQDNALSKEADKTVQRLKDKAAEKSLLTARFYESQKHYQSAIIYYQDILDNYPGSSFVNEARTKIEKLSAPPKSKKTVKREIVQGEEQAVKGWKPLKFTKQPKSKVKKEKSSSEKVKLWNPLKFESKPKPKAEAADASAPAPVKKGWLPSFGLFGSEKKTKPAEKSASSSSQKIKLWNPLKFDSKPKPKKEKADGPAAAKKGWLPSISFSGLAKKVKSVERGKDASSEKVKIWNPFKAGEKAKSKEISAQTEAAAPKLEAAPAAVAEPQAAEPVIETKTVESAAETKAAEPALEEKVEAPAVKQEEPIVAQKDMAEEVPAAQEEPNVEKASVENAPAANTEPQVVEPVTETKAAEPVIETKTVESAAETKAAEPALEEKVEAPAVKQEEPAVSQEPLKSKYRRKAWAPFQFGSNDKQAASAKNAKSVSSEKVKIWNPFKIESSSKPKETPAPKKTSYKRKTRIKALGCKVWNPFAAKKTVSAPKTDAVPASTVEQKGQ